MPKAFIAHPVIFTRLASNITWDKLVTRIKEEFAEEVITIFRDSRIMERTTPKEVHKAILTALQDTKYDPQEDYFLAAGDMTIYGAMLLVSANHYSRTPRQLRHNRSSNAYEVLPVVLYPYMPYYGSAHPQTR